MTDTNGNQFHHCFVCGPSNPQGLHLHFETYTLADGAIISIAPVYLTRLHEGPTGYIHGGIIAALLDEAMGKLNIPLKVLAVTRNMEVDYLRPAPLETPLVVTGRHLRRKGRRLYQTAELTGPDGKTLARAKALFIVVDPSRFLRPAVY